LADWETVSALATAVGTLALATATLGAVRSANRAARVAERSLLAGQRPLLMPSRPEDAPQRVGFADDKWLELVGGSAAADQTDDVVYLAISVRNVGTGIAVLHGWRHLSDRVLDDEATPDLAAFNRLARDLYIPTAEIGFWQGAFRDPSRPDFGLAREAVVRHSGMTVDLLYGDFEGGQRMVTRFLLTPDTSSGWIATVSRHWNIDLPDPRRLHDGKQGGQTR
jgi:hypothetical protein